MGETQQTGAAGDTQAIRIGTRGSDLALYQARRVARHWKERTGRDAELVLVRTQGDRDHVSPLAALGGVGAFTKELEDRLLDGTVDIAVHSLKDLPTRLAPGLALAAVPERVDPRDVLVCRPEAIDPARRDAGEAIPLREGARLGTSSRRRRALVRALRDDISLAELRGNVPTRVDKVRRGDFDATLLAKAGLDRLAGEGLDVSGVELLPLPVDLFVPAPGQAALAIETREGDAALRAALVGAMHDAAAAETVDAERTLLHRLEGGCSLPLGAHAQALPDGRILLRAALGGLDELPRDLHRALVRSGSAEAAVSLAYRALVSGVGDEAKDPAAHGWTVLAGRRVAITRPAGRGAELARVLRALGADPVECPAIAFRQAASPEAAVAAVRDLPAASVVLFASRTAVGVLARCFSADGGDLSAALRPHRVGAVGSATAHALAERDVALDILADRAHGVGLAETVLAEGLAAGTRVLLPRAIQGRAELADLLSGAGLEVSRLDLYETHAAPDAGVPDGVDLVLFASPSAVKAAGLPPSGVRVVAIGQTTASALLALGCEADAVATEPGLDGQLDALAAALRAEPNSG